MNGSFPNFSLIGIVGLVTTALSFAVVLLSKQFLNDPKKKAEEDKTLLKKLLKEFDLEIPTELQEIKGTVIKSIKTR